MLSKIAQSSIKTMFLDFILLT
ncbi:MAG: hypothetical protein ACOYMA_09525 [Bacteroidia bacterium]